MPSDQDPNPPFFLLGTHADLDSSEEDESLPDIPVGPWVTHANEVGVLWSAEPVCMTQASAEMQSEEWTLWQTPILDLGVLVFTSSPCHSPILPVKKEGKFGSDGNQISQFV